MTENRGEKSPFMTAWTAGIDWENRWKWQKKQPPLSKFQRAADMKSGGKLQILWNLNTVRHLWSDWGAPWWKGSSLRIFWTLLRQKSKISSAEIYGHKPTSSQPTGRSSSSSGKEKTTYALKSLSENKSDFNSKCCFHSYKNSPRSQGINRCNTSPRKKSFVLGSYRSLGPPSCFTYLQSRWEKKMS